MALTSPPKRAISRTYFEAMYELAEADGRNRVCTPDTARFVCACAISFSKSDMARSPLMMKSAPSSLARSTTSFENWVMRTLSRWASDSAMICLRSSSEKRPSPFWGFRMAATMTWSKRYAAVSMISRCPLWNGSNEPG